MYLENARALLQGIMLLVFAAIAYWVSLPVLRAHDLSGSVARHLSGCHSALKGVRNDADTSVTGDTEDEIRGSV